MDQAQFMIWPKTRSAASNFIYDNSREEEAFAEDAAGMYGGCAWPPRSYTCSFCRREFKTAQALGGHMNLHRRERARLKQSLDPHHGLLSSMACPNRTAHGSFVQPMICQSFLNPTPNSALGATAMLSSPSMVTCQSSKGGPVEPGKFPPYFPPTFLNDSRNRSSGRDNLFPSRSNWSDRNTSETSNKSSLNQKDHFGHESRQEPDFPMSLSLATRTRSSSDEEDEEETLILATVCKRRRTDEPSLPFLLNQRLQAVVDKNELSDSEEEGLDLQLRLGERPKSNSNLLHS